MSYHLECNNSQARKASDMSDYLPRAPSVVITYRSKEDFKRGQKRYKSRTENDFSAGYNLGFEFGYQEGFKAGARFVRENREEIISKEAAEAAESESKA